MMNLPERFGRAPRARDHALGLALACAYFALLSHTADAIGLARDEGIYVQAAERYGAWIDLALHEPRAAFERARIDEAFAVNHEHPPLVKLLAAAGHLAQQKQPLFASESRAFRAAGMLAASALLWLVYSFGVQLYGPAAGLFSALIYALLPRPFYHSHLIAFDIPITLATTATTYLYFRSLERPRFALLLGPVFGLALLTKHNSWLLPCVLGLHFACCAVVELRARRVSGMRRLSLVPYGLCAMCAIGPLVFYAGWPWLWHDTLARLRAYAEFHLHHAYYNMEYFGVNYFWPPFPSSYAWVMTWFTVPLTTCVLGIAGALSAGWAALRSLRALFGAPASSAPATLPDPTQPSLLGLGSLLAPLVLISIPTTPIFGGTKHWFPAYPLFALLTGRAFVLLSEVLTQRCRRPLQRTLVQTLAGAWLLAPAALETAHSHPFALSHYTVAAGGVPGAAEKGMNRQFWGFTTRSLVPYLRSVMPNGGTLYICDTIYPAFEMLIRDGHLPATFRATADIARADYALVHHEKHFAEVDHQIWTVYQSVRPAHVLLYDGVPIISVYKNPRR